MVVTCQFCGQFRSVLGVCTYELNPTKLVARGVSRPLGWIGDIFSYIQSTSDPRVFFSKQDSIKQLWYHHKWHEHVIGNRRQCNLQKRGCNLHLNLPPLFCRLTLV